MPDEIVTIVITGNSTEAVAAAEKTAAAVGGIGTAAKRSAAESVAASTRFKSVGAQMSSVGKSMTRHVTLPILGIGAAAAKLSLDFGKSMLQIQTHTDTTRRNLDLYKQSILDMASSGKYTQGPKELADAMYHIASDGFKGAKAVDLLKSSADLAMVGQSNLAETTYALVSAQKTAIRGTGDLHKTIGTLNGIVGAGDMKMQDLVGSLSTGVLPAAKSVGLSLKDVGAALDVMTSRGVPAQQASYRLAMNFQQLVPYTEKAQNAFKSLGLGQDELAKKVKGPHGFLDALQTLQDHLGKFDKYQQGTLVRDIFGGGRSSRGILQLLQNLGDMKHDYERINYLQKEQTKNIEAARAAPVNRLAEAWSQVQADLIKVGDVLVPIIVPGLENMAKAIGGAADAFGHLDPGMQSLIIYGGLAVAAIGPLLKVLGFLAKGYGTILAGAERLDVALGSQVTSTEAATAANAAYSESMIAAAAAQKELLIANASGRVTGSVPIGAPVAGAAGPGRFSKYLNRGAGALAGAAGAQMVGSMVGGKGGNLISKVGTGAAAGSMFGLPGAAVGAGIGAVVADIELLSGAEKKLAPFQLKLANSSKEMAHWFAQQHQASAGLVSAEQNVTGAKAHQKDTTQELKKAERARSDALKHFGPDSKPVMRAEYDLARARNDNAQATRRVENAERLHGNALQMYKAVTRSTMAEERHRIHLLGEQSQHLQELFKKEQFAGASSQRLAAIGKRGLKVIHELKDEQGSYAKTVGDATAKAGAKWAKHMKDLPTAMLAFGKEINPFATKLEQLGNNPGPKKLAAAFADMDKRLQPIMDRTSKQLKIAKEHTADYEKQTELLPRSTTRAWGALGQAMIQNTKKGQGGIEKVTAAQGKMTTAAKRELPQATGSFKDFSTESNEALGQLGGSFNAFLEAFKQKPVDFTVTAGGGEKAQRKAGGGFIDSPDRRDHVHALLGGDEAVVNVHQQPEVQIGLAISKAMGYGRHGSLQELFAGVTTPNHFAAGGFASKVPREVMHGKGELVPAGQKGLDMARHAGLEYVAKHAGGDRSLQALVRNANAIDARHFPYRWGGGHQSSPAPWMVPYDCSGLISALVQHSGWKDIPTMVSGGFEQVGQPGPGKFSILANAEHVYSVIGGKAFGTSDSNPGGGAGWISEYTYRPGFTVRHLPVMGEGDVGEAKAPKSGRKGPGQKQAKGFAAGGFAGVAPRGGNALAPAMLKGLANGGFAGASSASPKSKSKSKGMVVSGKVSWFGGGSTAGGSDTSKPGLALNLNPGTESGWNNPTTQGWMAQSKAGHPVVGSTSISGHHAMLPIIDLGPAASTGRAIDVTEGGLGKLGFSSSDFPTDATGTVTIEGATATAKEEQVPAVFHGVTTGTPSFGSVPKTLHGVKKEIKKREGEMDRYHKAVKAAKDKPKLERALVANITALRTRLKQLRRAASLLRRKAAQRKVTRALAKKLAKITGAERNMEGAQRLYEKLAQNAEQIVALEPQPPTLPSTATEAEQNAAEKSYVAQINAYIANQEKPAYGGLLEQLGNWRDTVLGGESIAGNLETKWEAEVRDLEHEIDGINKLTGSHKAKWWHEHPDAFKKMKEQRARLPMLRFREREVRKTLGEGRTAFYPGRKDPITPPAVPIAGTGTMEDMLVSIQGIHWPDYHSIIDPLPIEPAAGAFGGYIFDTQLAIRDLGLKIDQNSAGIAGSPTDSGGSELKDQLTEAINEQNRIAARKQGIESSLGGVLAGFQEEFGRNLPYVGAFADGGIVPGRIGAPGLAVVHGGEAITPVGGGGDTHIYLAADLARIVEASAPGMAKTSDKMIGRQTRKLSFAPGH